MALNWHKKLEYKLDHVPFWDVYILTADEFMFLSYQFFFLAHILVIDSKDFQIMLYWDFLNIMYVQGHYASVNLQINDYTTFESDILNFSISNIL